MDSSGKLLWLPHRILVALLCVFIAAPAAKAANLTTFEEYAAMTIEQRSAVRAYAMGQVFRRALEQGDEMQDQCMRETFLLEYGDNEQVTLAHARLRGRLDAAIENPNPKGRVEYLVAHHAMEVCPPTEVVTNSMQEQRSSRK